MVPIVVGIIAVSRDSPASRITSVIGARKFRRRDEVADRPAHLPDYLNPPIEEVAIAVQFPSVEGLYDAHVGLYWQMIRNDYPRVETHPRIDMPIESADIPALQPVLFPITGPLPNRTWLISEADDFLVQVQSNKFAQNWRRRKSPYSHFETLWEMFNSNFGKFQDLLKNENLTIPAIQQIEITYINWVTDIPTGGFLKAASYASITAYNRTFQVAGQNFAFRYDLNEDPIERLYVQCQPAIRTASPEDKGSQFAFVYRATRSDGLTGDEVANYAHSGREVIVQSFSDLTTEEAQRAWGKLQ